MKRASKRIVGGVLFVCALVVTRSGEAVCTNSALGAAEVSACVQATRGAFFYSRTTHRFVQTVTLRNTGDVALLSPVSLVLDRLSTNAMLYNATGTTSPTPGNSYINLSVDSLSPGAAASLVLQFTNPSKQGISYCTRVFAGPPPASTAQLVARWTFDEGGTSTAASDSTTNHLDGVLLGDPLPSWTAGIFSNALEFDGVQNQVQVADANKLTPRNALTVSAWVKPATTNEDFTVAKWAANGLSGSYLLWVASGNAEFHVFLNGTPVAVTGTNVLTLSHWHNVTGTYDATNLSLYVDGALDASISATGTIDVVGFPLQMGGVQGALDDVCLYNYALASTNVAALYNADTDGNGMPNWWQMKYFGHLGADPNGDANGDGIPNLKEYRNGTDPTRPQPPDITLLEPNDAVLMP